MGKLDGRVAIVSGGARGQGEAIGRRFVAEGARVVLGDVRDAEGEAVAADLGTDAIYRHLDIRVPEDWTAIVKTAEAQLGPLSILINNAGITGVKTIEDSSLDDYLSIVNVNQIGCFNGMHAVVPAMKAAGGGAIVNTASVAGVEGFAGIVAYAASKWAIRGMTRVAALELGRHGIRVNCVIPGGIDTPMAHIEEWGETGDAAYAGFAIPRIGTPDEIAKLMVFLASDDSSYSTGSDFVSDGGQLAGQALGWDLN
jgi:3alpha(or 20beta)-hydroxysteroid dehydrogenase